MIEKYEKGIAKIKVEQDSLNKKYSSISVCRLLAFAVAVILIFTAFTNNKTSFLVLGILFLVIFIVLIYYHSIISNRIDSLNSRSEVLEKYIMRLGDGWKTFEDDGREFLDKDDTVSKDIDLLGAASLFQFLSVAHTKRGRKKLATSLQMKHIQLADIELRNEAICELMSHEEFIINLETVTNRIPEKKIRRLETEDDIDKQKAFPMWMKLVMFLIPLINVLAVILTIIGVVNYSSIIITILLGAIVAGVTKTKTDSYIAPVYKVGSACEELENIVGCICEEEFRSKLLFDIKKKITGTEGIVVAIKKLSRINQGINISYNPILHFLLNGFAGWDFYLAFFAESWSAVFENVIDETFELIANIEEMSSLAVLGIVRKTVKPVVNKSDTGILEFCNLSHPLIDPEKVVCNSASLSGKITIITGSNMSGKTTFLRTVAINIVLAYSGANVCAESFSCDYMKIFTSMRVMDDVSGGISTFYAEILRIKEMAEYVKNNDNSIKAICFIDEIFKGTNSADRIVGAKSAINKLSEGNSMIFVSTHDFELCELESKNGEKADNYHFEEHYEEDKLLFDYKIKNGRCTTRNAIAILKMAGLCE